MDFVHDQTAMGTKIRILTIVDTFTRFSPAVEPRFRYRGSDVVETLERVGKCYGLPKVIRVDQGSEFVSRDLDLWAQFASPICTQVDPCRRFRAKTRQQRTRQRAGA